MSLRSSRSLCLMVGICALSVATALAAPPVEQFPPLDGTPDGSDPAPPPPASTNVEIIVNNQLYTSGLISAGLNQYVQDLVVQGYNPTVTTTAFADESALRSHLAGRYNNDGLAGAVFIGDVHAAQFEIAAHGSWGYADFPCDLYYQDVDGTWADVNSNGKYDSHTGNVAPEIWVGRLLTHKLTSLHGGRTEAGMLNEYFTKNHAYRYNEMRVSEDGLAYVDDDWIPWATSWANDLQLATSGTVTCISNGTTTNATDYKARLPQEREHLLLCAHSNPTLHAFKVSGSSDYIYNSELEGLDPGVLFYNLFCCSNAKYTTSGYMAGEYVFGTDMGLLSVGSTKTGSMLEFDDYYRPLGNGALFGEALLDWWLARAGGGFSEYERDWHYGMTMIGDPLLVTQQYLPIPEPATLSLLALAATVLVRRRRGS